MPRANPNLDMTLDINVAKRVEYERNKRCWTYEETAKRLTDAGCAIHPSAIQKIEKGKPRRKVLITELVGFSEIFEVPLEEMMLPLSEMNRRYQQRPADAFKPQMAREELNKIKEAVNAIETHLDATYRAHQEQP